MLLSFITAADGECWFRGHPPGPNSRPTRQPALAMGDRRGCDRLSVRLVPVLRGGGLFGIGNYDDAVYYAAATGLIHGQLPYQDFLLLHPPGMPLLLSPFALLAQLIGDPYGFAVARLAWMVLGAVNAVLIWRILRPVGMIAAVFGGLGYAVFYPAVYVEKSTLLESPATTALLLAMLMLQPLVHDSSLPRGKAFAAGALLGLTITIKVGRRHRPDRSWLVAVATPVRCRTASHDRECGRWHRDLFALLRGGADGDVEPDRARPAQPGQAQRRHDPRAAP